jgi:O-antigen/teichoic acid export membrane protein
LNLYKATSAAFLIRALGIGSLTLFVMIASRNLDVEDYGRLELFLAILNITGVASLFGFNRASLKFVSGYTDDKATKKINGLVRTGYAFSIASSLTVLSICILLRYLLPEWQALDVVALAFLCAPFFAIALLNMETLRATGSLVSALSGYVFLRHVIAIVSLLVFMFVGKLTFQSAIFSVFIGLFCLVIWDIFRLYKFTADNPAEYDLDLWVRTAFPMFLSQTFNMLTMKSDLLVVGATLGVKNLAYYAVAKRIANLIGFAKLSAGSVFAPKFSLLYHRYEQDKLTSLARSAALIIFTTSLLLSLPVIGFTEQIVETFGSSLEPAVNVTIILVVGQLISAFFGMPGMVLNMLSHQKSFAKISGITSVLAICLAIPAALIFGIEGVALVASAMAIMRMYLASKLCNQHYSIITTPRLKRFWVR